MDMDIEKIYLWREREAQKGNWDDRHETTGNIDWLIAEVERLQIQLRSADKYSATLEKCVALRCVEIADNNMGDSHYPQVEIAMNIRREFNLPKAG